MWKNLQKTEKWTLNDAAELYGIYNWGQNYFAINEDGEVVVTPSGKEGGPTVSLAKVLQDIKERGFDMPVLLRIENILGSQIKLLHESFGKAIEELEYEGSYRGVYPIKVNQQEQVLEAITHFGKQYNHGLEAGSKAELIAAISMMTDREACLVCNGYKDEEFVDLGLLATKMGLKCFFVIEAPGELSLILERAKAMGVRPNLGVRIKLSTKATGQWSESGGDTSVFGLNMSQVVEVVDTLKEHGMLDCLLLLHYHIGSQIPNIHDVRAGVLEACRIYEGLVKENAKMGYLDLGGGLAVDYDGSSTNNRNSRNYSIDEYCFDVVETIMTVMDGKTIPHPTIITESGRTTVAYYSMLLFNILDVSSFTPKPIPESLPEEGVDELKYLLECYETITPRKVQECYNDAIFYRDRVRQLFKHGQASLRERAIAEDLFRHILIKLPEVAKSLKHVPDELKKLDSFLSDIYYGNFSLFQSLPDVWAIGQLFPVMPIHRLLEKPSRPAILADITCDCDGKIDRFVDFDQVRSTLPLHELKENEEYYMGVFLVGAYQETLGDLHNLLGDTNVVSIKVVEDNNFEIVRELEGDTVSDVLSYVEYDLRTIKKRLRELAENSIQEGYITPQDRRIIMEVFDDGLRGYTYFEK